MLYEIEMEQTTTLSFKVDANSTEEAEEKAYEVYNKAYEEGAIEKYGYDTDCKVTMVEKIQ